MKILVPQASVEDSIFYIGLAVAEALEATVSPPSSASGIGGRSIFYTGSGG